MKIPFVFYLSTKIILRSQSNFEPVITGKKLLNLLDDLFGMSARQPVGCLGVSRGDDGDHILVLVDEALRQPVVIGLIIEPEDPSPLVEAC